MFPAKKRCALAFSNRIVPPTGLTAEGERLIGELGTFSAGAIRLIHAFTEDLPDITNDDPAAVGIERLVE